MQCSRPTGTPGRWPRRRWPRCIPELSPGWADEGPRSALGCGPMGHRVTLHLWPHAVTSAGGGSGKWPAHSRAVTTSSQLPPSLPLSPLHPTAFAKLLPFQGPARTAWWLLLPAWTLSLGVCGGGQGGCPGRDLRCGRGRWVGRHGTRPTPPACKAEPLGLS